MGIRGYASYKSSRCCQSLVVVGLHSGDSAVAAMDGYGGFRWQVSAARSP